MNEWWYVVIWSLIVIVVWEALKKFLKWAFKKMRKEENEYE